MVRNLWEEQIVSTSNTEAVLGHRVQEWAGKEPGILCPTLLLTVPGDPRGEKPGTHSPVTGLGTIFSVSRDACEEKDGHI